MPSAFILNLVSLTFSSVVYKIYVCFFSLNNISYVSDHCPCSTLLSSADISTYLSTHFQLFVFIFSG